MSKNNQSAARGRAGLILLLVRGGFGPRHLLLGGLASLAIAASVALAVSLEMAARSVRADLDATASALSGNAALQIAGGSPIPEALLEPVRRIDGVAGADPITLQEFSLADGPHRGSRLHVVGVDFLSETPVHDISGGGARLATRDTLALVAERNALIVTDAFRERAGLTLGDEIAVRGPRGGLQFVVRGVLENSGLGRAYGSQVAVMDVYSLQALVGREGFLDAITISIDPDAEVSQVQSALEDLVDGVASVTRAGNQNEALVRSMGIVQLAVGVMVAVGMGVAILLAYGTAVLSTEHRAAEFALLRIGGIEARRVRNVVVCDGLIVGAAGTVVGIPAGIALARLTTDAFSGMTAFLGIGEVPAAEPTSLTIGLGVLVGLVVSGLGTALPARRAAKRAPLDVLHAAQVGDAAPAANRAALIIGLCATVASMPWFSLPGSVRIGLVVIAAITLIRASVQLKLPALFRRASAALERALPGVGYLVGIAASAKPMHAAVAVSSIAALLGTIGAIGIVVSSLAISVDEFIGRRGSGGSRLSPSNPLTMHTEVILPETIARVRSVPGVQDVAQFYGRDAMYRGTNIIILADETERRARHLPKDLYAEKKQVIDRQIAGEAAISEVFARRFGTEVGDSIALDTPAGGHQFRIAAIRQDFNPVPAILFDHETYNRHWPYPGASSLRVWTDEPAQPILDDIVASVAGIQPLFSVNEEQMKRWGSDVAAGFSGLLDAVSFLVASLGGVAVLNLLAGSVTERRREFALLHASGVSRRQIGAAVALDALAISCIGALCGAAVAVWLAGPMIDTVEETFTWTLVRHTPWSQLGIQMLGVVVLSTLAGSLPVRAVVRSMGPGALQSE